MQASRPGASKVIIAGGGDGALPERVQTAAIEVLALVLLDNPSPPESSFHKPGRLIRLHRRPADLLHQQPGDRQRLIAHHLGRQPEARSARQQAVLRIALHQLRASPPTTAGTSRSSRSSSASPSRPSRCARTRSPASRAVPDASAIRPASRNLPPSSPARRRNTSARSRFTMHARRQRIRRIDQPPRQPQPIVRRAGRQAAAGRPARRARPSRRACRTRRAPARTSRAAAGISCITITVGKLSTNRSRSRRTPDSLPPGLLDFHAARTGRGSIARILSACAGLRLARSDRGDRRDRLARRQHRRLSAASARR